MFVRALLVMAALFFSSALSALEIFINRAYTTDEKPVATIYATGEGALFVRLYRIDDVHGYLAAQANAHTVTEKNERLMQPGYFLWRSVVENFEFALYQIARRYMRSDYRERLRADLGLNKYSFPFRDRFPETNLFAPLKYPIVGEKSILIRARHWQAVRHDFGKLNAGYYLAEVSQGRHIAHAPLVVSDVAMVAKTSPVNALIYAVNLKTGQVLPEGVVTAYARVKNELVRRQTLTLKGGLAHSENTEYLKDSENTLYVLQAGNHFAFSDLYAIDVNTRLYESAIYSDRPVYRIGDTVQVRAVFQRKQGAAAHGKVKYRVLSGDNETVISGEGDLTPAGGIAFSVKTQNLKPARYSIEMELMGEKHTGSFLIEQYKKPQTRSTLTAVKAAILSGENIAADLSAGYYSGEPLAAAAVEVTVERQRISYPWWWGFGYSEYYGEGDDYSSWEFVKDFDYKLDAQGKLAFRLPTESRQTADYAYRIRTTVKAQNREETQATARVKVYRAPVALRVSQENWYFSANQPVSFKVTATSVADSAPVKTSVEAQLLYRSYDSKTQKYIDTTVATQTLKTDDLGEARAEFAATKRGGSYLIRVSASAEGRITDDTIETYVFGAGELYDGLSENVERSITVSADKKKYELFDTANFAIRLPVDKKLPVLITLENDRIRKYKLLDDSSAAFVYAQQLTSELTPNFDFTVTALGVDKQPRIFSGSAQVVLPPKHRMLNVELIADRERYRPGEEANILVRTLDEKKNPVSAEFSLGVVDEAIYEIREDRFKSLPLVLNPKLYSAVVTGNSLAFNFYGYGAEKSLYALYRNQMADAAGLRKGESRKVTIRKNFKDTALFEAFGKTGPDGVGRVRVPLPDNLTEWRITTHAHSSAGMSGSERLRIVAAKDFALRLAQPRFLRERDEATLRLLVSNQLKEKQTAVFETKFEGLKLARPMATKLEVPPGTERFVDFTVTVPSYPQQGKSTMRFIARSEKDNDGIEMALPVLPYGVENYAATQRIFADGQAQWKTRLSLDADARAELAELTVSFIPGTIPSILETLPYLIQYPYGCVEQTLSTFLPAVWASAAAGELRLPLPVKKAKLAEITDAGLKKLYGYQHGDGGWGWWSDDATDLYMTAYTLWGLGEAAAAKIAVDRNVTKKGMRYLSEQLTVQRLTELKDTYATHRLLFAQSVWVAASPKSALTEKILADQTSLLAGGFKQPAGLALVLQTAVSAGNNELKRAALTALAAQAKKDTAGTYFESDDRNRYYWYNDREETTAQVLNAVLRAGKQKQIEARDVVSYLISQKKQHRWRSTKLSAQIVRGFAQYAVQTGEKALKQRVSVTVDGERRDIDYDPKKAEIGANAAQFKTRGKHADVTIERSGNGFFLARAEWKHYLNKPLINPREGNFAVSRRFYAVNKQGNTFSRGEPRYAFKAGELVMTELNLKAQKGSEYLLLEDMIPAGFEPLTQNEFAELGDFRYDGYANSPAAVTRLDDRVALAKTYLGKDSFVPRAFYRAVFPGKYQTMPAQGGLMYYPDTFAYSASDVITISE